MYLRWQYVGPCLVRGALFGGAHYMRGVCRYRLSVVESRRDATSKQPRQHVVCYLGVVNEAILLYWPPQQRLRERNRLIDGFQQRLGRVVASGVVTPAQEQQLRAAINAAFPKPPAPIVRIPARVRAHALTRCEQDIAAADQRDNERGLRLFNAMQELAGQPPVPLARFLELLEQDAAKQKKETPR